MSEGNRGRPHLLLSLLDLLILLSGLVLLIGGIKLVNLSGSLYYLLAGISLVLSELLLLLGKCAALGLYALVLFASTVWALWEVGLDWWQPVPCLALQFVSGLPLWLPWFHRPLLADGPTPLDTAALGVAVVLAGAAVVSSQFTNPGQIVGRIDHDSGMTSTAPVMLDGDWQAYGRTEFGDRYLPLKWITPVNVDQLEEVQRIYTGDLPTADDPLELTNESTPLEVNGMPYACTAHSKALVLDPDTGAGIRRLDPQIQSPVGFKDFAHMTRRGVSYYNEKQYAGSDVDAPPAAFLEAGKAAAASCPRRLFLPTADARLIAINADNGKVCEDFGVEGAVDLTAGIGPFTPGGYYFTSPTAVTHNLMIIGGYATDSESTNEPSRMIRAFDMYDGKLVWNQNGGNPDEAEPPAPGKLYTRNSPNVWSLASVDEKLDQVYLLLGNQIPDQWGSNRTPSTEKFSAGLVALDLSTGKLRWSYQFIHHDLWDMDVGSQPTLLDLKAADGVKPALIAPTKQGSLYVLDRRDGTPIVPVREMLAPWGAVESDHTAPTQARSDLNLLCPPLIERDMRGSSPFNQILCRTQLRSLRYKGQYTPPSEQGNLIYPGNVGVFNWDGVSVDPVHQILSTSPNYMAFVSQMVPRDKVSSGSKREGETSGVQPNTGAPYAVITHPFMSPIGLSYQAPFWGDVVGIDLITVEVVWWHRNGTSHDDTPVSIGLIVGVPSMGGLVTTAGGVAFLSGTLDQYLRAYDVEDDKQLWQTRLSAGGQATSMSYTGKDGRQYVLIVAGGRGPLGTRMGDYIIVYTLLRQ